jgi:hypothetical protein
MSFNPTFVGLLLAACALASFSDSTASAEIVDITMTGTLSSGGDSFPWGCAVNGSASSSCDGYGRWENISGDSFVANFQFNTSVGTTTTSAGPVYSLSGPATIVTGTVTVAGLTFSVPTCVDSPCTTTTSALYERSSGSLEVLVYEDGTGSSGLVLHASAITPWGASLTDPIPTTAVTSSGLDIVLQPPNEPYDELVAFATVNTLTVTAATPLPATWTMMLIGLAGLDLAGLGFVTYRQQKRASIRAAT